MDVQAVYAQIGGDYADALERLRKPERIEKYLVKFRGQSLAPLEEAVAGGNAEEAFLQAHTLKGICANLSLTRLANSASDLTENLRARTMDADTPGLLENVKKDFALVMDAVSKA